VPQISLRKRFLVLLMVVEGEMKRLYEVEAGARETVLVRGSF
jgi:hypothetical protein